MADDVESTKRDWSARAAAAADASALATVREDALRWIARRKEGGAGAPETAALEAHVRDLARFHEARVTLPARRGEWLEALRLAGSEAEVARVRQGWERALEESLRGIGDVLPEFRSGLGRLANETKRALEAAFEARQAEVRARAEASISDTEWVDPTLPGEARSVGTIHPVAQMTRELEDLCTSMGFSVLDGPWVEDAFHNFEALNIPADHPARDAQDTFFLRDGRVLRTHTSPSQIRAMEASKPPIRAFALGRVFRNEALDASHENTFHQVEGFLVDEGVHVGHLVYVLRTLLGGVFRREVEVRLRPSFFPFTEPSFELDVRCLVCGGPGCPVCKRSGWVELLGCGLVHPNVLRAGGIDPARWSGFAFGLGIDRLVMMRHAIEDIRHLMGGDLRFLRQFARGVRG
jgi:phenylalanyl-tRNA synthetase alpha chain